MKTTHTTTIEKLPNGIYYHCDRCQAWVSTPCGRCEFRHGQVLLKTPNASSPDTFPVDQFSRILATLMNLILGKK